MRVPEPMLAAPVETLPRGDVAYEIKWDGYRCLLGTDGGLPVLRSRRGTDLAPAFADLAEAAVRDLPAGVLLDGEIVIWHDGRLDFGRLQRRLGRGPAAVAREIAATPAHYVVFDLLHEGGEDLLALPYRERRRRLEALCAGLAPPWTLCPMTRDRADAEEWMRRLAPAGVEGIVAKRLGRRYEPGRRGWSKVRSRETTEAVVGAVTGTRARPGSLLLGRYDGERLRYTGRTTPLAPVLAREIGALLAPAPAGHPWAGRQFSAGWGTDELLDVTLVSPRQVLEVAADVSLDAAGRWRHPVRAVRLRPDMSQDDVPAFGAGNRPAAG
ncbi:MULTISPECIES: ATP-dependent DNA ligase [Streptomyces]|uniref:ATP-dependent DNA ligase n=1 Tax=Streptomyces TaxID=1883 RepID=UPI000B2AB5D4|nr:MULTISPECIES: ATP-dependent DNA ligase [Streptomyces]